MMHVTLFSGAMFTYPMPMVNLNLLLVHHYVKDLPELLANIFQVCTLRKAGLLHQPDACPVIPADVPG